jgi:hypothetical protein
MIEPGDWSTESYRKLGGNDFFFKKAFLYGELFGGLKEKERWTHFTERNIWWTFSLQDRRL